MKSVRRRTFSNRKCRILFFSSTDHLSTWFLRIPCGKTLVSFFVFSWWFVQCSCLIIYQLSPGYYPCLMSLFIFVRGSKFITRLFFLLQTSRFSIQMQKMIGYQISLKAKSFPFIQFQRLQIPKRRKIKTNIGVE